MKKLRIVASSFMNDNEVLRRIKEKMIDELVRFEDKPRRWKIYDKEVIRYFEKRYHYMNEIEVKRFINISLDLNTTAVYNIAYNDRFSSQKANDKYETSQKIRIENKRKRELFMEVHPEYQSFQNDLDKRLENYYLRLFRIDQKMDFDPNYDITTYVDKYSYDEVLTLFANMIIQSEDAELFDDAECRIQREWEDDNYGMGIDCPGHVFEDDYNENDVDSDIEDLPF